MDLLYFILAAYGLTQILVYGSIFNGWRPTKGKLGELFKCSMCVGFWTSYILNMTFGDEGIKLFKTVEVKNE